MRKFFTAASVFLIGSGILMADVYSLLPFKSSSGSGGVSQKLFTVLGPANLMTESVQINGMNMKLNVGMINDSIAGAIAKLKKIFPRATCWAGPGNARIDIDDGDYSCRILLFKTGYASPLIQFGMRVPKKIPKNFDWPRELPITSNATPIRYVRYPDRKSCYGQFATDRNLNEAFNEISATLSGSGWTAAPGNDAGDNSSGMFINTAENRIMMVNFAKGQGSVYVRPLDGK